MVDVAFSEVRAHVDQVVVGELGLVRVQLPLRLPLLTLLNCILLKRCQFFSCCGGYSMKLALFQVESQTVGVLCLYLFNSRVIVTSVHSPNERTTCH